MLQLMVTDWNLVLGNFLQNLLLGTGEFAHFMKTPGYGKAESLETEGQDPATN